MPRKISQMSVAVEPDFTEDVPMVQLGGNVRIPLSKAQLLYSVFRHLTAAEIAEVRAGTATTDLTAKLAAAMTAAAGKVLYFPKGTYLTGRLLPDSNTVIMCDPGVTIRKKNGGTQVMKIADKQNVHILGNGCTFDGQTHADATSGDTLNISDSQYCTVQNVHVLGAGTNGSDCIYIGSDGNDEPCEHILIFGGSCKNAKRNGISVVAGKHVIIDNVEISGTTLNPGAGIDVEANVYDMLADVEIRNCSIHNNNTWGIAVVYGSQVHAHHNRLYDNGNAGIGTAASGTQFNRIVNGSSSNVARLDTDIRALTSVNTGTGELGVSGFDALEVGTIVSPRVRNGATLPTGLTVGTNYIVWSKSGGNIVLSVNGGSPITSFAGAGSGSLTSNGDTSDWYLLCYERGQCDELNFHNNWLWGNNQIRGQIDILTSVGVRIVENYVEAKLDQGGISVIYCREAYAARNTVVGVITGTSATARGIHFGVCSKVSSERNEVSGFPGPGINLSGLHLSRSFKGDSVTNCGVAATRMYAVENVTKGRVEDVRLRSDPAYVSANGLQTVSGVTNTIFRDVDAQGTGTTNATSMAVSGSGNRYENCVQFDGTYYLTGSATYDPGNLVDGAGADASSITVTGAALGDFAEASFSLNTQGIDLIARVSAANTVIVRFQNETGGAIDLASGTLRVQVRKP